MADWLTLTRILTRTMNDHAPGWTEQNDRDPGVTVLEMLAYLADGLPLHHGVVKGGTSAASRAIEALQAYADDESAAVRVNGQRWTRVETLDGHGPDARVFILEPATGLVTFGDGKQGARPEPGSAISVRYVVEHVDDCHHA